MFSIVDGRLFPFSALLARKLTAKTKKALLRRLPGHLKHLFVVFSPCRITQFYFYFFPLVYFAIIFIVFIYLNFFFFFWKEEI